MGSGKQGHWREVVSFTSHSSRRTSSRAANRNIYRLWISVKRLYPRLHKNDRSKHAVCQSIRHKVQRQNLLRHEIINALGLDNSSAVLCPAKVLYNQHSNCEPDGRRDYFVRLANSVNADGEVFLRSIFNLFRFADRSWLWPLTIKLL